MAIKNVRISNSVTRKTVLLDDSTTIRNAFANAEIECSGLISINGCTLGASELDDPITSFGINSDVIFLQSIQKLDNAYGVKIFEHIAVVTCDFTSDEIVKLQKYDQESVALYDKNNNPSFIISCIPSQPTGTISQYGIVFGYGNDKAKVVINIPDYVEDGDRLEYVVNNYGDALKKLKSIEENINESEILTEMAIEMEDMLDRITIVE